MASSTDPKGPRVDAIDRRLLAALQRDATAAYAELGRAVGLSAGAAHERVRKLRERGVVRSTTVDVDPAALGKDVLAFVTLDAAAWMGDAQTAAALAAIPEVEEAHIVAGAGTVLVKVRAASTRGLQSVLRRLYAIDTVAATDTTVVLETLFTRPVDVSPPPEPPL